MSDKYPKTNAMFPVYLMEFRGKDDAYMDGPSLGEVVDGAESGEIEIRFSLNRHEFYLNFRLKDLLRAVKEFKK